MRREQILKTLKNMKDQLDTFQVRDVFLFGSASRGENIEGSDIDLLIDFSPTSRIGLFGLAHLQKIMQDTFHCKVDLVIRDALHPALRERILKDAIHVF